MKRTVLPRHQVIAPASPPPPGAFERASEPLARRNSARTRPGVRVAWVGGGQKLTAGEHEPYLALLCGAFGRQGKHSLNRLKGDQTEGSNIWLRFRHCAYLSGFLRAFVGLPVGVSWFRRSFRVAASSKRITAPMFPQPGSFCP